MADEDGELLRRLYKLTPAEMVERFVPDPPPRPDEPVTCGVCFTVRRYDEDDCPICHWENEWR